ncbi:MAG TPA: hypothetical protein VGS41_01645 [Chthonomonadales bacterium]|nr:hypothetical protein [Chthonomonadales bacterium]
MSLSLQDNLAFSARRAGGLLVAASRLSGERRKYAAAACLTLSALPPAAGTLEARLQSGSFGGSPASLCAAATLCAAVIAPFYCACAGAAAAPRGPRREQIGMLLLTGLNAGDIVIGRIAAAAVPALLSLAIQAAGWSALALALPAAALHAGVNLIEAYLIIAAACAAACAVGYTIASRRSGSLVSGAACAVGMLAWSLGAIFALNGAIGRMDNPAPVVESALLVNPAAAALTAMQVDTLRMPLFYQWSDAPDYPFAYPSPVATASLYLAAAAAAASVSAAGLKRRY